MYHRFVAGANAGTQKLCHRFVAGVIAGTHKLGVSGASSSRDGPRGDFDLGAADFPTLPDVPDVPCLRFASGNTGDVGSGAGSVGQSVSAPATLACEDTTESAKPPSETAGATVVHEVLPREMFTTAITQPPAETTDPSGAHEQLPGCEVPVLCFPDSAQRPAETASDYHELPRCEVSAVSRETLCSTEVRLSGPRISLKLMHCRRALLRLWWSRRLCPHNPSSGICPILCSTTP